MRLLFDTSLAEIPKGGIERYVHNLTKSLCLENDIYFTISSRLKSDEFRSKISMPPVPPFRPAKISGLISSFFLQKEIRKTKIDLVHVFNYSINQTVREKLEATPLVCTVYDLTPEIVDEIPPHTPYEKKKALFDSCKRIISISQSTKKDLIQHYGVDQSKIDVVYLATDFPSNENAEAKTSREFIHIGHRAGYKNFECVAVAFSEVSKGQPDVRLTLVGGGPLTVAESDLLAKLGISGLIRIEKDTNDTRIQSLLKDSLALLSGSLNEGFGLTFLEAMQCGSIPIASQRSSIPEVLGDAGIQVDTTKASHMAQAMLELLENPDLRGTLRQKCFAQAKKFSWEKTARDTLAVYKRCLEQ